MLDNWLIADSFVSPAQNQSWQTLLNSLVLWDEIWYFDNFSSTLWKDSAKQIYGDIIDSCFFPINSEDFGPMIDFAKDIFFDKYKQEFDPDNYHNRTKFYYLLSNLLGINLLFHEGRGNEISDFTRMRLFDWMDKSAQEYYKQLLNQLDMTLPSFDEPMLYSFIQRNSASRYDEFNTALQLRCDNDLICFKESLDNLEENIQNGDIQKIEHIYNEVVDIARKANEKYKPADGTNITSTIKMNFSPTINWDGLSFSFSPFSFGVDIGANLKKLTKRNKTIHTTFIKKLYANRFQVI